MTRIDELQKAKNELAAEIEALQQKEDYKNAAEKAKELTAIAQQIEIENALETARLAGFKATATKAEGGMVTDAKKMRNRVFNKLLLGRTLTDEEREFANVAGSPGIVESVPNRGGYLVPDEQIAQLREYRKAYTALKDYTNVQTANSDAGRMPTLGAETGMLTAFDELTDIKQSDMTFGQLNYAIRDYGDIIPVSNTLLADADINLMDVIGRRFARKAVNTENNAILTKVTDRTEGVGVTGNVKDYKAITKAINVDLDPVYYSNTRIFTNQSGFQWLAELEDGQKRPLLVPDVAAADSYRLRGKEIVVLSDGLGLGNMIHAKEAGAPVFIIGSMSDYIAFFQRDGVEVSISQDFLFGKNATALRCVERFGVSRDDTKALKVLTTSGLNDVAFD